MRKIIASLLSLGFIPVAVLALDYSDPATKYEDADTLTVAENAAVGLLTYQGSVEGNPDGTFRPDRMLNRAEFLKIASSVSGQEIAVPDEGCFPDIRTSDWFMAYVCTAFGYDYVRGYPDGLFHPERNVNYAEAVKILVNMFGYNVSEGTGERWYVPYMDAAADRGVLLPSVVAPDHFLTRGQMARLAAAFYAETLDELDVYREAEKGNVTHSRSSSSMSSVSSRSSSSASSNKSSSSLQSSVSDTHGFPAQSHILILGERTPVIASAKFFANLEPMHIRAVKVVMEAEYESIASMYMVDSDGKQLGQLTLDSLDLTHKTWRTTFSSETGKHFDKDSETVLGIEVLLKGRNEGGTSEEQIQVDSFDLTVEGEWSQNTYQNLPAQIPYPQHQTAQAEITEVKNALKENEALPVGTDQLIAGFSIGGRKIAGAELAVETLEFDLSKASAVTVSSVQLGASDTSTRSPCTVSSQTISCASIPAEIGSIGSGPRTVRLFADIALASGTQNPFLQISLNQPGSIGVNGAIRWTDGTGHFTWVEMEAPIARGTRFE